jgi:tetratricopeptide (TPR) repeat protein
MFRRFCAKAALVLALVGANLWPALPLAGTVCTATGSSAAADEVAPTVDNSAAPDKSIVLDKPAVFGRSSLSDAKQSQVNALISDALNLLRANRNDDAAAELKRALSINPNSAEAHHNYGLTLAKLGDMPTAIAELKTATTLKPDMDASWLTLAGLQQASGKMDDAIATYQEFLTRFKLRTDLNDTSAKVKQLLAALQDESQRVKNDREQQIALSGAPQALLQAPALAVSGTDDYLAEVLPHGRVTRWPQSKMPLRVYIHDQSSSPSFKRWKAILISSFQDWSSASGGRVTFKFTDDANKANWDLDCVFVLNQPAGTAGPAGTDGLGSQSEAGEAAMYLNDSGISTGTIKLQTSSMSPVLPLTDNRMRTVCLHEIGHALGLAGHTANPEDIMFYSTSFKDEWRNLNGRDARTIQHLYGSN